MPRQILADGCRDLAVLTACVVVPRIGDLGVVGLGYMSVLKHQLMPVRRTGVVQGLEHGIV